MKVSLPILAGVLLIASPLAAREPPNAAPAATRPDNAPNDADKPICRRLVVVGSRLPGPRVCRTKAQWRSNDRDSQDATRKIQENRRTIDPMGG